MDFARLTRYLPAVEDRLRLAYARERREAPAAIRPYVELNRGFSLRGGKRFRAIALLAGYHLATGREPTPAVPAAAALEHFQSWMLIHDDIIDHAVERRGGPALHLEAARVARASGAGPASAELGVGLGITLGDLEEPFTVEEILAVRAPPAARLRALDEYHRMTRLTAWGQLLDLRNGLVDPSRVTEADVLEVHRLKSAVYTVAAPLKIGALLGGATPPRLTDLEAIALDLGVAFQLRDDVLGAGFDADASGKSANDLVEGKRTLLVVRAWTRGSAADRSRLRAVLGNAGARASAVDRARDVIRSTGSLAYSERRIAALTRRALARLARSRTVRSSGKPLVAEIADRLVRRRA